MIRECKLLDSLLLPNRFLIATQIAVIVTLVPLVYWFVWTTGGSKFVFSHTMYFPIIVAGLFWGLRGGLLTALAGGILLGPLMPIDVSTGERQLAVNWLFRLGCFLMVSATIGLFADNLKKHISHLKFVSIHNGETGLLNLQCLDSDADIRNFLSSVSGDINIIAISWNNRDDIINLFGSEICAALISDIDKRLQELFFDRIRLIQSDNAKFYAIVKDSDGEQAMARIVAQFETPFEINGVPYYIAASMGLSPYTREKNGLSPFQKANIASIHSKKCNRSSLTIDDQLIAATKNNILLLGQFPRALSANQLLLYYQPKYDLKTRKPVGFEALIRWMHPERGLISPGEFIPLIEESYLIQPLTEWVLSTALAKLKEFEANGVLTTISINISPKNIESFRFLERLSRLIRTSDIRPNSVEFEITESALMNDPVHASMILQRLKEFDIGLSIDDFGTGYSSLSYLNAYPIDIIKLDQSFIKKLTGTPGTGIILEKVIDMAHNLGFRVIAEGIEDRETERQLIDLGCDMGQGYHYSKPVSDTDIINWYKRKLSDIPVKETSMETI